MNSRINNCSELPPHIAARGVVPMPGDGNETQNDHERLAANVRGPQRTAQTGYVHDCQPACVGMDVAGSGSEKYNDGSGTGRYIYNDPVDWTKTQGAGITSDTSLGQPNVEQISGLPTQAETDAVVAQAASEENREVVVDPV